MQHQMFHEYEIIDARQDFLEGGQTLNRIADPLQIGWRERGELIEWKELDPSGFSARRFLSTDNSAFVEMGPFGKPIDRNIIGDEPMYFDSKSGFFQHFPYNRALR